MAENKKNTTDVIQELALVTDAIQTIFPSGKIICVYELNEEDFKKVQTNFRKIDHQYKKFSVDISGLEHVFIQEETIQVEEQTNEIPKKNKFKNFIMKLLSMFKSSRISI